MKFAKRVLPVLIALGVSGVIIVLALAMGAYYYIAPGLPSAETIRDVRLQVPLRIYTRDGKLMGQIGEKKRTPVAYEDIPPERRARFTEMINGESQTLSTVAEALAAYLDTTHDQDRPLTPVDETERFFEAKPFMQDHAQTDSPVDTRRQNKSAVEEEPQNGPLRSAKNFRRGQPALDGDNHHNEVHQNKRRHQKGRDPLQQVKT